MLLAKDKLVAKHRSLNGFGLVETVTSACFVIVAIIMSLDCWFMISAARINDAACRDAARAAAQAGDSTTATNLAIAVVQSYARQGSSFMTSPVVSVTYTDYGASSGSQTTPPANTPPSVTVVSTCTVKPIMPLTVLGNSFGSMQFSQTYSFPIIKTKQGASINNS